MGRYNRVSDKQGEVRNTDCHRDQKSFGGPVGTPNCTGISLQSDGTGRHNSEALTILHDTRLMKMPQYSPEFYPAEH
jgi:hypothetical protein